MSGDFLDLEGDVLREERGVFHVVVTIGGTTRDLVCHLSRRLHRVAIVAGDRVALQVSPYDVAKGRIVKRL
jgi:translation initiation factor IF-1